MLHQMLKCNSGDFNSSCIHPERQFRPGIKCSSAILVTSTTSRLSQLCKSIEAFPSESLSESLFSIPFFTYIQASFRLQARCKPCERLSSQLTHLRLSQSTSIKYLFFCFTGLKHPIHYTIEKAMPYLLISKRLLSVQGRILISEELAPKIDGTRSRRKRILYSFEWG